jgi:hypothetical protein
VTPHPEANYHAKCVALAKNNPGLFQPGKVVMVNVLHDDWCAIHENRPCDCDCDVKLAVDETKNVAVHSGVECGSTLQSARTRTLTDG